MLLRKHLATLIFLTTLTFALFFTAELKAQACPEDASALTPAPLEESWSIEWWMNRHESKLNEDGRESAKVLWLGDSITHGWENSGKEIWDQYFESIGSFNLGFGGDRTENVLWRIENGALEGLSPDLSVLMIGTNNTGHRQDLPECTALGIEMILNQLLYLLPDSQILLLAIFPRGDEPGHELRQLNDEINKSIALFNSKPRVHFVDINQIFLTEDGFLTEEIMPDMLHPNEKGYLLWANEITPVINNLLNR